MKKLLLILTIVIFASTSLMAQSRGAGIDRRAMRGAPEMILIENFIDDDYSVKRYLVKEKSADNDEFKMHYRINLTKLLSAYDDNSAEIEKLHTFINGIKEDSLKQITRISIVGYTSPDGPASINSKLSVLRATDCEKYLDQNCGMSAYPRTVKGVCSTWQDARPTLVNSVVPNKAAVISEIDQGGGQMIIESDLKRLPKAWSYICKNTLPPMRCVDIEVGYNSWRMVEEREVVETPVSNTIIIDMGHTRKRDMIADGSTALLFAMPDQPLDYKRCKDRSDRMKPQSERMREKYKMSRRGAKFKERERGERDEIKAHYRNARHNW